MGYFVATASTSISDTKLVGDHVAVHFMEMGAVDEEEEAAVRIQARARGKQARRQPVSESPGSESPMAVAADAVGAAIVSASASAPSSAEALPAALEQAEEERAVKQGADGAGEEEAAHKREGILAFVMFKREKERGRERTTRSRYREWLADIAKEFADLDPDRREAYEAVGRVFVQRAKRELDEMADVQSQQAAIDAARAGMVRSVVSEQGTDKQPFPTEAFLREAGAYVRASQDDVQDADPRDFGFTRYAPLVREKLLGRIWQEDLHHIGNDEVYTQ